MRTLNPNLLYSNVDTARGAEVRDIMSRALKEALPNGIVEHFIELLNEDSKLVYQSGLSPKKLPDLVDKNPEIAIEVLLKLISSAQIAEFVHRLTFGLVDDV